ncbi:putative amino acid transporter [Trypanosoma conorhini]|uniref:Putative amino acid transporter n=1 Tax=Trypanosoma conorhini TaxID=83891 RepID=A0A3R7KYI2_9TRYP|nr:putative amino acid transporter [Trypanosoma conorhini]RNF03906.1 putative amino acid transporter [Trypanosoma conorhini]
MPQEREIAYEGESEMQGVELRKGAEYALVNSEPEFTAQAATNGEEEGARMVDSDGRRKRKFPYCDIISHGGMLSGAYNLASVTLGSGIITLPSAFNGTGIVLSLIILVFISAATVYSTYILALVVEKTGFQGYEKLARGLLGRGWDFWAAFNMWMFCFGSCVSYVISVGDMLTPILDDPSLTPFLRTVWGKRCLVIVIWACVMLPLSIPKQINSLRYASVVGVSFMMFFVLTIVVHAVRGFEQGKPRHELKLFRSGNGVIVGFSLFIFAFLCQTNCLEVYAEMRKPAPRRMARDTALSMVVCCLLYILAGFFGYADFGDRITDSILLYYNVREDPMVAVAYAGLAFKLCVGFAICMQPSRDSVYHCIGWHVTTMPFWKNAVCCTALSIIALLLGLFIPSITIVFSLVGSLCGGFLGFIFPSLFYMYAGNWTRKSVGWSHYLATYFLLLSGVVAVVFGTTASIFGVVQDH